MFFCKTWKKVLIAATMVVALCAPQAHASKDVVLAIASTLTTTDPWDANDTLSHACAKTFYEGLFGFNEKLELRPVLAESYDVSPDGLVYTFHLRKGVKFHDGTDFNAEAVKVNFDRVTNPENKLKRYSLYSNIAKTEVVDDLTAKVTLKTPFSPFINQLAHPSAVMISPTALKKYGKDIMFHPVGTGPYKFVAWYPADRIEMVAFDDYWGEKAAITNLTWRTIPEIASRSIEVEAGTVDVAIDIQASELARLEKVEKVTTFKEERSSINFICLNNLIAPFDNVKVRQAINMAIDVDAICNVVYQGTGAVAQAPMSKSVWAYNDNLPPHERNVEKAKELLAEAGYPDGFTCTMTCDQNQQRLDTAEMVQMQLAEIGITMKIASMERGTFIDNVISGNLEMFGLGWTADTGDPDYALFASFHSSMHGEGGNMSFYTNPEVDRLLDLGRSSTDPEVRKDAYYKVQEIVWNEVPCVFLQCPEDLYAYNSNLKNFATNADGSIKFAQLSWN